MKTDHHSPQSYRGRIDGAGRVTIPADLRLQQGLHSGDEVVFVSRAHGFEVKTYEQTAREAQDIFCRAAPKSRVLSQELIDERGKTQRSMTDIVLDASAVLAFLRKEAGSDIVFPHLRGGRLCAVNYSEVLAKAADLGVRLSDTEGVMNYLGIRRVPFDDHLAMVTASLRPLTKAYGLSLADRACLALGSVTGLPVLTADRDWAKAGLEQEIRLIR